ncbi:hypothetical protein ABK040_010870 [Willaertia magna]
MPREIITIQVGQCGNQIGCRMWDLILREHAAVFQSKKTQSIDLLYDDPLSTFFKWDFQHQRNTGGTDYFDLKARAVLVDMEEGVLTSLLKGNLGGLFDKDQQFISDVSGAGNNWAHGHEVYGPQYHNEIVEKLRKEAEICDSLQSFFILHSLGGGTGSGLGSYISKIVHDEFEDIYSFTTCVFPSKDSDDVVTSPYNAILSLNELTEHSDCVLPIENQALFDMCQMVNSLTKKKDVIKTVTQETEESKPFDQMNDIAASLLSNLTCSMRFEGSLNVDLNEITMNLVPYPKLKFLLSSLSPFVLPKDVNLPPRRLDQMFKDVLSKEYQLLKCDPIHSKYLSCGLILRGQQANISDINRNISKMKSTMDMIYWNQEGFKTGLCNVAPHNQPYSLLCLANNCCFGGVLSEMEKRASQLYKKKFYVHHYTKYMEGSCFDNAIENIKDLMDEYNTLQNKTEEEVQIPRFIPEF